MHATLSYVKLCHQNTHQQGRLRTFRNTSPLVVEIPASDARGRVVGRGAPPQTLGVAIALRWRVAVLLAASVLAFSRTRFCAEPKKVAARH